MTKDEKVQFQRETAALLLAAMVTTDLPPPPPAGYDVASDADQPPTEERIAAVAADNARKREEFERARNLERARLAMEAFMLAGALVAESELWSGPQDSDGEALDERAFDRECVHGRKMSEPCAECDQRQQAAKEGKPAEAASGEGTDSDG